MTSLTGTLQDEQYTFIMISFSVLRMRNVSDNICREKPNTRFV